MVPQKVLWRPNLTYFFYLSGIGTGRIKEKIKNERASKNFKNILFEIWQHLKLYGKYFILTSHIVLFWEKIITFLFVLFHVRVLLSCLTFFDFGSECLLSRCFTINQDLVNELLITIISTSKESDVPEGLCEIY